MATPGVPQRLVADRTPVPPRPVKGGVNPVNPVPAPRAVPREFTKIPVNPLKISQPTTVNKSEQPNPPPRPTKLGIETPRVGRRGPVVVSVESPPARESRVVAVLGNTSERARVKPVSAPGGRGVGSGRTPTILTPVAARPKVNPTTPLPPRETRPAEVPRPGGFSGRDKVTPVPVGATTKTQARPAMVQDKLGRADYRPPTTAGGMSDRVGFRKPMIGGPPLTVSGL
jgi:hypothetical protein